MGWKGVFELVYRNRDGRIIEREILENDATLLNGGEEQLLDVYFRNAAAPATWYLRLYQHSIGAGVPATLPKSTSVASLAGEVSGPGYAPIALARGTTDWPTKALDGSNWVVGAKLVVFEPTSSVWTPYNFIVCATTTGAAGPIVSYAKTQAQRTLQFGVAGVSKADVTYFVKLK